MAPRTSKMGSRRRLRRFLWQETLTGTDQEIATTHEINRQNAVKEIFLHVFFLSKFDLLNGPFSIVGAKSQYISGRNGNQAAHCAPGQIRSGSQRLQDLITTNEDLEMEIENLFGKTDVMHYRFNKADSDAESNGLLTAFLTACTYVANGGRYRKFNRAREFYPLINEGFAIYRSQGLQAFNNAIAAERNMTAPLALTTRGEVIAILEFYRSKLDSSLYMPDVLDTILGLDPEEVWRDYALL